MEFTISATGGESVTVQSDNWMMALGKAISFFNLDPTLMGRWVITPGLSGVVHVEDPVIGKAWTVKPVGVLKVVAIEPTSLPPLDEDELDSPRTEDSGDDATIGEPPPLLTMPMRSQLAPPPPEPVHEPAITAEPAGIRRRNTDMVVFSADNLAERLFDLSMELAGAPAETACEMALLLSCEMVPCEASSVARGSAADFHLTIAAATGPVADQLIGRKVPFGEGIVGLCFDARIPVQINDAQNDERHNTDFDQETGFITRDVLCVPVIGEDETVYGVIQLINPEVGIAPEHVDALVQIARTLASALARAE